MDARIRALREQRGWSQQDLAGRAGVTRQLVGSIEAGRHSPSVAAALALARALGTSVETLFGPEPDAPTTTGLDGRTPSDGLVVAARVGHQVVAAPLAQSVATPERWDLADAHIVDGALEWLDPDASGALLVAGCDPLLGLVASLVERTASHRVVAVHRSTGDSVEALGAGLVHGIVVHGPEGGLPDPPVAVRRIHLARWQVGLAASSTVPSLDAVAAGRITVVQREPGAATQQALVRALGPEGAGTPPGPIGAGHLDVARRVRASTAGIPVAGMTMEAAAGALGLAFEPLETHQVELWIDRRAGDHPGVAVLLDQLGGADLARRVGAIGGYDLSGVGDELG